MESRLIFLRLRCPTSTGRFPKLADGVWLYVGWGRRDEKSVESIGNAVRTENQHRWTRRVASGERENPLKGTRQKSGRNFGIRPSSRTFSYNTSMHAVYVLQHTVTKEIYIGKTRDLKRRIQEHNAGLQISTRRHNGTWQLLYCEIYRNRQDADLRERKLKQHGSNKRWLLNRIKHSLLES